MKAVVMFGQVGIEAMGIALHYIHRDAVVSNALANLFIQGVDFHDGTQGIVFSEGSQEHVLEIASILKDTAAECSDTPVQNHLKESLAHLIADDHAIVPSYEDSLFLVL